MHIVQMQAAVNPGAASSLPPPGGGNLVTGTTGAVMEQRAAFESMMSMLIASLNGGPLPMQPMMTATGESGFANGLSDQAGVRLAGTLDGMQAMLGTSLNGEQMTDSAHGPLLSDGTMSTENLKAMQADLPAATSQMMAYGGQTTAELLGGQEITAAANGAGLTADASMSALAMATTSSAMMATQPQVAAGEAEETTTVESTTTMPNLSGLMAGESTAKATVSPTFGVSTPAPAAAPSPTEQVTQEVQLMLNRGEKEATIRLQPEELGVVRVRLQFQDGRVHLSIQAEQHGTSQLMAGRLGELRLGLEGHGVKIGDLVMASDSAQSMANQTGTRDVVHTLRTNQMDMSSDLNQNQSGRQPTAFAGDGQPSHGRQGGQAGRQYGVAPGETDRVLVGISTSAGYARRYVTASGVDTYA